MSNSADSLKKKVCVTVFLDELFEEVLEENWRDFKQVSELTESEVKFPEKPLKGPPRIGLDNDEKVNISPNADTERKEVQLRPRKHRRESKFSENRHDPLKEGLVKAECGSNLKTGGEYCEPVASLFSDSDFDLNVLLDDERWTFGNSRSRSSLSDLSEGDISEDSFLSIQPASSSLLLCCSGNKKDEVFHVPHRSRKSKSIRCAGSNSEGEVNNGQMGDDVYLEKEGRHTGKDILSWKKTQREIEMVLANAKGRQLEKETSRGDFGQYYDLRSILEACVKAESNSTTNDGYFYTEDQISRAYLDSNDSCSQDLRDSYTGDFPRSRQSIKSPHSEMSRVCYKRNLWNDCLESDLSEADCPKSIGLHSLPKDSVLCYTLCLKCKRSIYQDPRMGETTAFDATQSSTYPTSRESSYESVKSRASQNANLILRTVTQLANKTMLGPMLENEQKEVVGKGEKISQETCKCPSAVMSAKNSLAEGDALQKSSVHTQKLTTDSGEAEEITVSEKKLSETEKRETISDNVSAEQAQVLIKPEIEDVEKTEIELRKVSLDHVESDGIAEYLFKHQRSLEKSMTDAESEMIFAESENSYECDDLFESSPPSAVLGSPRNNICVVEFEDKLSRSKILRRMKTVEILGDNSSNDVRTHISTEVFLMCENISSNEVCLEAWHSSASTLRSITEMGQCYLKDSKDSAMYLIEIPLHFINTNKRKPCKSEQVSESE